MTIDQYPPIRAARNRERAAEWRMKLIEHWPELVM
jgi:hypothetical protein